LIESNETNRDTESEPPIKAQKPESPDIETQALFQETNSSSNNDVLDSKEAQAEELPAAVDEKTMVNTEEESLNVETSEQIDFVACDDNKLSPEYPASQEESSKQSEDLALKSELPEELETIDAIIVDPTVPLETKDGVSMDNPSGTDETPNETPNETEEEETPNETPNETEEDETPNETPDEKEGEEEEAPKRKGRGRRAAASTAPKRSSRRR